MLIITFIPSFELGVTVDYNELIEMTTGSIIGVVNKKHPLDTNTLYKAFYKDGCDGAGSQRVWNSTSMAGVAENMFQYALVPLRFEAYNPE